MSEFSSPLTTLARPDDAATLSHLDMLARVRLTAEQTGGAFGLIEQRGRVGACTPAHRHRAEAETLIVLDGALEGWAAGDRSRVEAGDFLHLPADLEHAFRVVSETAHFMVLVTPGGFEQFFTRTGRAHDGAFAGQPPLLGPPPTDEQVAGLASVLSTLGVELTGPPPF